MTKALGIAALAAVLVLAACGGGYEDFKDSPAEPQNEGERKVIALVRGGEFKVVDEGRTLRILRVVCDRMNDGKSAVSALKAASESYPTDGSYMALDDRTTLMALGVLHMCDEHYLEMAITVGVASDVIKAEVDKGNVPPDYNVDPNGICIGTPCGSDGRPPRCDEIGLDPSMCGPDGIYRP